MEDQKVEIIITDRFCMYLNLKDDFKRKYNDSIGKPNILIELSNDIEFMQEFQNQFDKTELVFDVYKYWRLIYSKKQILAGIYRINGITNTTEYAPLESELDKRKNDFLQLINKGTEPKECYTHNIEETNICKQFRTIEDTLNRFKEMKGFDMSVDSLLKQAEEFGKGLISEINNVSYEPIRLKIIEVIIENKYSIINEFRNSNKFDKKKFLDNYLKAKMYLNNYLSAYLEKQNQQIKFIKLSEDKDLKISLEDFLINPDDKHKIPLIVEKFKNDIGKSMAIAIYLLRELNIFNYEINSKTKSRADLAKQLNPTIKMNGVNMHFTSNTYNLKSLYDDDLIQTKQWLNGL